MRMGYGKMIVDSQIHYIETIEETAARLEYLETQATEISRLYQTAQQNRWDCGAALLEVRKRVKFDGASWMQWIDDNLPFKHDTATRLMDVASSLPRPIVTALPITTAYALTKAPEAVRTLALENSVQNAAVVQLLVSAYRSRDENDDYREIATSGGWVNAHDEFIALEKATPADVREYRTARQSARFHTYQLKGTIKRVGKALVIRGAVIPSDLADGKVRIVISREIDK